MVKVLKQFVGDERGFIVSSELVLIATLGVLGLVTGLTCVRDAVNSELQDVAGAIGSLNQSYCYTGLHGCISPRCGVHAWTLGSAFTDLQDEAAAAIQIEGGAAVHPAPAPAPVKAPEPIPCPTPAAPAAAVVPAVVIPCPPTTISPCPTPSSPQAATATPCPCGTASAPCGCATPSAPTAPCATAPCAGAPVLMPRSAPLPGPNAPAQSGGRLIW